MHKRTPFIGSAVMFLAGLAVEIGGFQSQTVSYGLFAVCGLLLVYGLWINREWFGASTAAPESRHEMHDKPLIEAIRRVAFGKWGFKPSVFEMPSQVSQIADARNDVMQRAANGELVIFGRTDFSGPLRAIPADYWLRCKIEFFDALKDGPLQTSPRNQWGSDSCYRDLATGGATVDQLWPRASGGRNGKQ